MSGRGFPASGDSTSTTIVAHRTEHGEQLLLLRFRDAEILERRNEILDERVELPPL